MALRNQPYLPLYIQDFMTDEKLTECSASATGVYIRLMCLMHKSEYYGKILLKQRYKQKDKQVLNFASQVAKNLPFEFQIVLRSLEELVHENVLSIEGDFLIQKRMVKDNDISEKRSISGKRGGDITKTNMSNKFAQAKPQANSENEIENENTIPVDNEIKKGVKPKFWISGIAQTVSPSEWLKVEATTTIDNMKVKHRFTPDQLSDLFFKFDLEKSDLSFDDENNLKNSFKKFCENRRKELDGVIKHNHNGTPVSNFERLNNM